MKLNPPLFGLPRTLHYHHHHHHYQSRIHQNARLACQVSSAGLSILFQFFVILRTRYGKTQYDEEALGSILKKCWMGWAAGCNEKLLARVAFFESINYPDSC